MLDLLRPTARKITQFSQPADEFVNDGEREDTRNDLHSPQDDRHAKDIRGAGRELLVAFGPSNSECITPLCQLVCYQYPRSGRCDYAQDDEGATARERRRSYKPSSKYERWGNNHREPSKGGRPTAYQAARLIQPATFRASSRLRKAAKVVTTASTTQQNNAVSWGLLIRSTIDGRVHSVIVSTLPRPVQVALSTG